MFAGVRIYVRSVCPIQQVSTLATHCVSTLTNSQFGHVCRPREFSHKCRATDTKTESRPADIPGFCVAAVILFLVSKPRCPGLIKVREQAWKINRRITLGPALSQAMSLAGAHVSQTSTPGRDLGRPLEEHPPAASSPWASQPLPPVAARVLVPIPGHAEGGHSIRDMRDVLGVCAVAVPGAVPGAAAPAAAAFVRRRRLRPDR